MNRDDIHGFICDECARTHCAEAHGCTCHEPGCRGAVGHVEIIVD